MTARRVAAFDQATLAVAGLVAAPMLTILGTLLLVAP